MPPRIPRLRNHGSRDKPSLLAQQGMQLAATFNQSIELDVKSCQTASCRASNRIENRVEAMLRPREAYAPTRLTFIQLSN